MKCVIGVDRTHGGCSLLHSPRAGYFSGLQNMAKNHSVLLFHGNMLPRQHLLQHGTAPPGLGDRRLLSETTKAASSALDGSRVQQGRWHRYFAAATAEQGHEGSPPRFSLLPTPLGGDGDGDGDGAVEGSSGPLQEAIRRAAARRSAREQQIRRCRWGDAAPGGCEPAAMHEPLWCIHSLMMHPFPTVHHPRMFSPLPPFPLTQHHQTRPNRRVAV